MTDMRLSLILEARAQAARAELGATKASVEALGLAFSKTGANASSSTTDLQRMIEASTGLASATGLSARETLAYGAALDEVRARFNPLFAASQRYARELQDIAAAEELGAISALEAAAARERASNIITPMAASVRTLGVASGATTANLQNLTFQLQDVAMMASLGQAPLATMLQQGPQIAGVFDNMRQSGQRIGPAILGALTSLISPMSLLTLGGVAAATMLIQFGVAAFGAGEEVKSLEERLDELTEAVDEVRNRSRQSLGDLREEFGLVTAEVVALAGEMRALDEAQAGQSLSQTLGNLDSGLGADWFASRRGDIARLFAVEGRETEGALAGFNSLLRQIEEADGFDDQVAAIGRLKDAIAEANGGLDGMSESTLDFYEELVRTTEQILRLKAATEQPELAAPDWEGRADVFANSERVSLMREVLELEAEAAAESAARADRDLAAARETMAARAAEMEIVAAIARYGEDSAEVEAVRAAIAREAEAARVAEMTVTEDIKRQLMASYDIQVLMSQANLSGPISAAADEAARLSYNLASAAAGLDGFGALSVPGAGDLATGAAPGEFNGGLAPGAQGVGTPTLGFTPGLRSRPRGVPALGSGSSGGGRGGGAGGGGAGSAADEVQGLIESLEDELEVLRETDPLQRELLRHREILAEATEQEAADIQNLVSQKLAEIDAQEALNEQMQQTRALGADLVDTLVAGFREGASAGDILADMLGRIGDKLIEIGSAGLTDALFGTGEAGGGSGLIGGFFSSLLGFGASPKIKAAKGTVVSRPSYFDAGGALGLMAEAGPEAIMPLSHSMGGGVGAVTAGGEITLPLTRLASGKLGVDLAGASPFALGGVFGDLPAASAPASWRTGGGGRAAPGGAGGGVVINLDLRGAQMGDDMIARIEGAVAAAVARAITPSNRAFSSSVKSVVSDTRRR